jgi:hypothetical protein
MARFRKISVQPDDHNKLHIRPIYFLPALVGVVGAMLWKDYASVLSLVLFYLVIGIAASAIGRPNWRVANRVLTAVRETLQQRSAVLPEALEALEQVDRRRIHRTRHYTIYYPATNETSSTTEHENLQLILLFPGMGVPDLAYAIPALLLSSNNLDEKIPANNNKKEATTKASSQPNYAVVVLATDPLCAPSPMLGYTADYLQRKVLGPVQEVIRTKHPRYNLRREETSSNNDVNWILMGHSLGGLTAVSLAHDLSISRVILWGPAPFLEHVPDLSSRRRDDDSKQFQLQILLVHASQDNLVRMMLQANPTAMDQFLTRLTTESTKPHQVTIEAGTHKGFGSYDSKFPEPASMGVVLLTRAEQQPQAVQATLEFLSKTKARQHTEKES